MVYLVPSYYCVTAICFVEFVEFVQVLVPFTELLDHEFLKLHDVYNVKLGLDLVENHDTQLVCNGAIAVFFKYQEDRSHSLPLQQFIHIEVKRKIVVGCLWWLLPLQSHLRGSQWPKSWEEEHKDGMEQLQSPQSD